MGNSPLIIPSIWYLTPFEINGETYYKITTNKPCIYKTPHDLFDCKNLHNHKEIESFYHNNKTEIIPIIYIQGIKIIPMKHLFTMKIKHNNKIYHRFSFNHICHNSQCKNDICQHKHSIREIEDFIQSGQRYKYLNIPTPPAIMGRETPSCCNDPQRGSTTIKSIQTQDFDKLRKAYHEMEKSRDDWINHARDIKTCIPLKDKYILDLKTQLEETKTLYNKFKTDNIGLTMLVNNNGKEMEGMRHDIILRDEQIDKLNSKLKNIEGNCMLKDKEISNYKTKINNIEEYSKSKELLIVEKESKIKSLEEILKILNNERKNLKRKANQIVEVLSDDDSDDPNYSPYLSPTINSHPYKKRIQFDYTNTYICNKCDRSIKSCNKEHHDNNICGKCICSYCGKQFLAYNAKSIHEKSCVDKPIPSTPEFNPNIYQDSDDSD